MTVEFVVRSLQFSDGTSVNIPRSGVTAIVGPNNSGKTVALQEIMGLIEGPENPYFKNRVVKRVEFDALGTDEEMESWIVRRSPVIRHPGGAHVVVQGSPRPLVSLMQAWQARHEGYLREISRLFVYSADLDSRAHLAAGSASSMDFANLQPTQPLHHIYLDGQLEERFSRISEDYFGEPLTLQRLGPEIRLRVGRPRIPVPPLNRPTKEYADDEASLPTLGEQGHGMRSFLGLLLAVTVQDFPVIMIDEPEAFLHPPQRRALGRLIGQISRESGSQVFVSTHDTEFLWGLLDGSADVTVVRLTRQGAVNPARPINATLIKDLWNDPLLRYSRIFDGIFYKRVIVCEGDADCRFYGAVLDYLVEEEGLPAPDCLLVPVGGKDKIPVAIQALRSVGVDVVAAVDFDTLRGNSLLAKLVTAAGGLWDDSLRKKWNLFANQVKQKADSRPLEELLAEAQVIASQSGTHIDRQTSIRFKRLFSYTDGWEQANLGLSCVQQTWRWTGVVDLGS